MKRLLIIKASSDICPTEVGHIRATCKIFDMESTLLEVSSTTDLEEGLSNGVKYDYIYLCAHANHLVFGDNLNGFELEWIDFGGVMCVAECMNEGCVFLLACCRTGLTQVSYDLFISCRKIEFVCGPRWTLRPNDLTIAFDVFIYNMEERREQPNVAAQRMSQATGYDFTCYDRVEMEIRPDYQREKQILGYLNENYNIPSSELQRKERTDLG